MTHEAGRSSGGRGRLLWMASVVGAYSAAAVVVTYPLVRHMSDRVAGDSSDIFIYPWASWWISESIRRGEALFYTPFLYFPDGASLAFHNLALPATGWALLLPSAVSLVTFYNALVLVALVSSALGAYLLALFVTRSPAAAFMAGMIFGFAPYRLEQARSHLTTITGLWLPLFLVAFFWLCSARSWRQSVLAVLAAGVCGVLALLVRADHLIAGLYVLGLSLVYPPFGRADMSWKGRLGRIVAVGACTFLLALPYLSLWFRHGSIPKPPQWEIERERSSVSVENLATPAPGSLLWRWRRPPPTPPAQTEKVAFVGSVLAGLLAAGAYLIGRDRAWRFWVGCGIFFILASLGPHLVLGERVTTIPLPYDLLPGVALVRNPRRFMSAAMLCLAMAAALSWRALLAHVGRTARRRWLTLALALLLLLEVATPPLAMTRPTPSRFYRELAASSEMFGIVEIPSNTRQHDKLYMFYQTLHGKPIHAGHMGRIPDETFHFIRAVGLLNFVAREGHVAAADERIDVSTDLDILRANNFRYIIFHKRFDEGPSYPGINTREARLLAAVAQAIGPPAYQDGLVVVFDVRRRPRAGIRLEP